MNFSPIPLPATNPRPEIDSFTSIPTNPRARANSRESAIAGDFANLFPLQQSVYRGRRMGIFGKPNALPIDATSHKLILTRTGLLKGSATRLIEVKQLQE